MSCRQMSLICMFLHHEFQIFKTTNWSSVATCAEHQESFFVSKRKILEDFPKIPK